MESATRRRGDAATPKISGSARARHDRGFVACIADARSAIVEEGGRRGASKAQEQIYAARR